jgi:hypothetical protein
MPSHPTNKNLDFPNAKVRDNYFSLQKPPFAPYRRFIDWKLLLDADS